jgi:O-antigen ligase
MSAVATASGGAVAGPRLDVESLRGALIWLIGFSGAFVFIEPSPYEIVGIVGMLLFAAAGLSLRAPLVPLVLLLALIEVGYAAAVVQVSDQGKPVLWVMISAFLVSTAVFYAAVLGSNTQRRLELLMRGYLAAAIVAALAAVAGYFHLLGGASDLLVLNERARGTFNDPNVLGAFLVLPSLLVFQRMLAGRLVVRGMLTLLLMLAALLLSFSRGAWGQFVAAAAILMTLTFVTSRSGRERLRIVLVVIAGLVAVVALIVALLSVEQVADLLKERAAFEQSYDVGRYGRFGRYALGADLALEQPFGIGPLQFSNRFVEDPHNTFLNAFMSGGWLTGFGYFTLCAVTVATSTRFLFVRTPWQPIYHAVYAAYVGTVAESAVIDIDHWRHYFLLLGVLWGLMAASRAYRAAAPPFRAGAVPA